MPQQAFNYIRSEKLFKKIPYPVGRLGLGLESEPHVMGRLGLGSGGKCPGEYPTLSSPVQSPQTVE